MSAAVPLRLDSAEGDPLKRREFALRHAERIRLLVEGAEASIAQLVGTELSRVDMLEVLGLIAEEADLSAEQLDLAAKAAGEGRSEATAVDLQPLRMADFDAGPAELCAIARRYAARIVLVAEGAEASVLELGGLVLPHQDMLEVLGLIGEEAESMAWALRTAEHRRGSAQGVPA